MNKAQFTIKKSLLVATLTIGLLWAVKIIEQLGPYDFSEWGIFPRHIDGGIGILCSAFIHGDYSHLLSNTFPLFFLLVGLFLLYEKIAFEVMLWIYLMSGFWVWIAGREAYHIGVSGIIYGIISFLLFSGIFRKERPAIAFALLTLFLYGGLLQGLFPISEQVSWESHLFGFLAGIICAYYFRGYKVGQPENELIEVMPAPQVDFPINYSLPFDQYITYHYRTTQIDRPNQSTAGDIPIK